MATTLAHMLRSSLRHFKPKTCQILDKMNLHTTGASFLYQNHILGLEGYMRSREEVKERVGDLKEKFRGRMEEYMQEEKKNTIFTDDLKMIIHVADCEEDLQTARKMIERYHKQSDALRFSAFTFGPLVMRMLHYNKRPDIAYQMFEDEELSGFFHQMSSFVVLMDLLFEGGMYEESLKVLELIDEARVSGVRFPTDCVTIALASCLKMNTSESYEKMMSLLKECHKAEVGFTSRGLVYAAMLALKQNKPDVAEQILSLLKPSRTGHVPVAVQNVQILCMVAGGRVEEAVEVLKAQILEDVPDPDNTFKKIRQPEIFKDVLSAVEKAVAEKGDKELQLELERVHKGLEERDQLKLDIDFDTYLFYPISRPRQLQDKYKSRQRSVVSKLMPPARRRYTVQRPGLRGSDEYISL